MCEDTGKGRRDDLVCLGCDSDRRGDADKEQKRCHKKTAAHAKHAGEDSDHAAKAQEQERVDRNFGDGEIDLHTCVRAQAQTKINCRCRCAENRTD